nr:MAG TPA: hypothetical protein [Caudoviricetes sp.]
MDAVEAIRIYLPIEDSTSSCTGIEEDGLAFATASTRPAPILVFRDTESHSVTATTYHVR